MCKTLCFFHQNQNIFFSNIGNQNIFLEKNHNPPWKLNGPSLIEHSKSDHSYADVVKFGDKHQNKHVGDHSCACTVEESGALHNKNNEKSIIPNPQIEQADQQDCVIEDGVFHDNLSKNSMAFIDHIPGDFNSALILKQSKYQQSLQ